MNILVFMNILLLIIIVFNMTYDEYKKESKKEFKLVSLIKKFLNKLFTAVIFSMIIIIISNYSVTFRNFLINDVLNNSMDFSKVNKIMNKFTNIYNKNKEETKEVSKVIELNREKYLDGYKYNIGKSEDIFVKDSGIVTYIGTKEGYGNTVIIQQSNGYYAWYGNVKEKIKLYDYVEKDSIIGTASYEYYYVLLKDDKPLVIDEY